MAALRTGLRAIGILPGDGDPGALRHGGEPRAAERHHSRRHGDRSAPAPRTGLLLLASSLALLAAGPLRAAEVPYPPASTFRTIQLDTLACGRENTPASCDKARKLADPLMDHPRLSTACKDALWAVRQKAVPAPENSIGRRDPIDKASRDVGAYCRQPYVPQAATGTENPGGKPFNLRSFSP